jgi:hypothetical protein
VHGAARRLQDQKALCQNGAQAAIGGQRRQELGQEPRGTHPPIFSDAPVGT